MTRLHLPAPVRGRPDTKGRWTVPKKKQVRLDGQGRPIRDQVIKCTMPNGTRVEATLGAATYEEALGQFIYPDGAREFDEDTGEATGPAVARDNPADAMTFAEYVQRRYPAEIEVLADPRQTGTRPGGPGRLRDPYGALLKILERTIGRAVPYRALYSSSAQTEDKACDTLRGRMSRLRALMRAGGDKRTVSHVQGGYVLSRE